MKPYYIIQLHPVKHLYLENIHHGNVVATNTVQNAEKFNTYQEAQEFLKFLLRCEYNDTMYVSILEFYENLND